MKLRNPVEYLHNPASGLKEVSVDDFFSAALRNAAQAAKKLEGKSQGRVVLWAYGSTGKRWVAELSVWDKLAYYEKTLERGWSRESVSETVRELFSRRCTITMSPSDEAQVQELLRLLLQSLEQTAVRHFGIGRPSQVSIGIKTIKDPQTGKTKKVFNVIPYLYREGANWSADTGRFGVNGDTVEEALLAAIAVAYGAQ